MREAKLSAATTAARSGGFLWATDVLEAMSERERVAKEVALEKALEAAQNAADAQAEQEEARRRREWRDRVKRAMARHREAQRSQLSVSRRSAEHDARSKYLGYTPADWDFNKYHESIIGPGGVGGRALDNLVNVERMSVDQVCLPWMLQLPTYHCMIFAIS